MSYNIVVCAKQVPDTKRITGKAMNDDGTVNRAELPAIFNPEDHNALEEALAVRDKFGGTVTLITMGPPSAAAMLREGLFMGADRAILITDIKAAASDTLATSYILSCAVQKLGANLVFCGRQAIDGDTAQVGPQMAEKLGYTLVTYLEELISLDENQVRARRNVGNGWEEVSAKLPALMTVMETANIPRPFAAKRMMKYKKARTDIEVKKENEEKAEEILAQLESKGLVIETWNLADLEADLEWVGMSGSPTKVHRIQSVVLTGGEYHEYEPTQEAIDGFVKELIEDHTIG